MQHYSRTPPARDATCLIVEDSQYDQRMMSRVIDKAHGQMKIEVAATLHAARSALAAGPISLILLDNNLPDGLGAEFAMELASDPRHAKIPVIMVSDWPTPFMWEKAAAAGVLYVVNKAEFGVRYVEQAMRTKLSRRARAC